MICDGESFGAYRSFARRIEQKAAEARIPIRGTVELTANCNLACVHCYIRPPVALPDPVSTAEWGLVFDKLARAGCLWLGITGGEPLLRSDFKEIYLKAQSAGFLITLMSNGTLIDDKMADFLALHPPMSVELSMYGASARVCNDVTGNPLAAKRCTAAAQRLVSRGVRAVLKTIVMRANVSEFEAMKELASNLGVPFRFDGVLNDAIEGAAAEKMPRLPAEELAALEFAQPGAREKWSARAAHIEEASVDTPRVFGCGAGVTDFHVTFEGHLCPCVIVRTPSVDLRYSSFKEAWMGPIRHCTQAVFTPSDRCYHCSSMPLCSTCAGFGLLSHGNPASACDFLCDIAKARKEAMFSEEDGEETDTRGGFC